jgi:DNA polymerase III epsilon subunit-like protein
MIAIDTEYISEKAVDGPVPGNRPDVTTTYCEIMQIGAAKLDGRGNEVSTLSLTIRPSFISHIPEWLSKMTGMTEGKRQKGITLQEGIRQLNDFIGGEKFVWTFSGDWHVFSNSAKKHDFVLPFSEFQLVEPQLAGWGVTEKNFKEKGFEEICSGDLHKVLGLQLSDVGTTTHDATYDARSLVHSVFYLLNRG